ncbi:HEAT repeat domain-containing protein [Hymenobacter sp. BT175]|uniref:HEAT repeat domain-containing protein n=1 Tax=Hymenobacter translucens TaxID=2886507 RepID=UPI001D0F28E8|nr:HEAT repeat domain-containing protein [Hymenobacter translucens]MCC2547455.1 HEAT repeat domain-containing protein [Hymenobacter translucens]
MEAKFIKCEDVRVGLMDWLANELPADEARALEAHLAGCPDCRREQAAVWQLWQAMGNLPVPEPSEQMRPQFYSMLAGFQAAEQRRQRWSAEVLLAKLRSWWQPAYAYSLVLLVVGLAAGYGLKGRQELPAMAAQPTGPAASDNELPGRQAQLLTLLADPSAVQRLRAVSYAEEIAPTNDRVVAALLSTLNQDPNVNVRLATLEVLAGLGHDPTVRQGLVRSLARQDSPLVQSALADVMVQIQEHRSVRPLRRMLEQENLNEQVKIKIEESIQTLSNDRATDNSNPQIYHETPSSPQSRLDTSVAT